MFDRLLRSYANSIEHFLGEGVGRLDTTPDRE